MFPTDLFLPVYLSFCPESSLCPVCPPSVQLKNSIFAPDGTLSCQSLPLSFCPVRSPLSRKQAKSVSGWHFLSLKVTAVAQGPRKGEKRKKQQRDKESQELGTSSQSKKFLVGLKTQKSCDAVDTMIFVVFSWL